MKFWMFASVVLVVTLVTIADADNIAVTMDKVKPKKDDTYLCTSQEVGDVKQFITSFTPKADQHHAHHMLLYGCETPGSNEKSWQCSEMSGGDLKPCKSGNKLIFAWAMKGSKFILPKDVSFMIGGDTGIKHLVLQIHYKNTKDLQAEGNSDSSGLIMKTTKKPTKKVAGLYLLATNGNIPAKSTVFLETACLFNGATTLHPFAFRVHTHKLGKLVTGFDIHENKWNNIGRMDPQQEQLFYPVENKNILIRPNDRIAARCVMKNDGDADVQIGPKMNDEMCNFYIMYWVPYEDRDQTNDMQNSICNSEGWPNYKWDREFDVSGEPLSAMKLPGNGEIFQEMVKMENRMNDLKQEFENEFENLPNWDDDDFYK